MFAFVKIVTGDVRVTRSICWSKNLHFGFFKESLPNFGYIHLKTPNSFLECQNKNIQISEFNQFRKTCQNNWILVEINWNLLKIVSYYIIQLCWRVWLIFKMKNQVSIVTMFLLIGHDLVEKSDKSCFQNRWELLDRRFGRCAKVLVMKSLGALS